jgi:SAM-dependent methyltransferase
MSSDDRYLSGGDYLRHHPSWHVEDSPWKARHVLEMMRRHDIVPRSVLEIGCGAGAILARLHDAMDPSTSFTGIEIAPEALSMAASRSSERLRFEERNILADGIDGSYDVVLVLDLIEHVEDYFRLLRVAKPHGGYFILHIPLDLSAQSVLRRGRLDRSRKQSGHIHYFTKDTALAALADAGFEVLDHVYTAGTLDLPVQSFKAKLARLPRRVLRSWNEDLAARLLGGFSLLVLAK